MPPDGTKIKLGTSSGRQDSSFAAGKSEGVPAGQPDVSDQRSKAGYSLELGRRGANRDLDEHAKAQEPVVRPWILVCFIGALVLLFVVVVVRAHGPERIGYNNQEILNAYSRYIATKANRGLPSKEDVRIKLNAIAYLENTGRDAEARDAWAEIMVKTQGDKDNPLYAIGLRHLEDVNRRLALSQ